MEIASNSTVAESALHQSLRLLFTRRFGTFWLANLLSSIGTWAQQVAQPWLLLSLGASSALVGLDAFAMNAPIWLLTLVGGMLADHADRRRVIAGFQSIQMLCPVAIVALLLTGTARPWMIIALSLVVGITDALSLPAFSSIVPSIVERQQIGAGLALNSTQFNISRIVGPALAGLLITYVGMTGSFVVSAASYLPFIGIAIWILPRGSGSSAESKPVDLRHPFAGIRSLAREPSLRGALLTTFASSLLCGPIVTFSSILVKSVFHGAAAQFGFAVTVFGCGGLLGAIGLLAIGSARDRRRLGTWFATALGATLAAIAVVPWFWALGCLLLLAGVSMNITNTAINTLVQTTASPIVRGQAVSLYMLAMRGGLALGGLVTGLSAHLLGIRTALLIDGLLAVLAQTIIARRWR
jgi:MFS family permease